MTSTWSKRMRRIAPAAFLVGLAALAGCSTVLDQPDRPTLFDLGPVNGAASADSGAGAGAASTRAGAAPPLVLPDIRAAGPLEGTAMLYRLGYADTNELLPYAESRWSAPAPDLVRERLAAQLARDRVVLSPGQMTALAPSGERAPQVLRIELQEFAQHFEAPAQSRGQVQLMATLLQSGPGGDRLLAQRSFDVSRPAPSPDARGGVRALSAAVDEAGAQIRRWLQEAGAAAS